MTRWTRALAVIAMLAPALPAAAKNYPSRPIRAIASQGAGGLSDLFMRALGQDLGPALGTSIVVEDRAGAEGTIGAGLRKIRGRRLHDLRTSRSGLRHQSVPSGIKLNSMTHLTPIARPYYLMQIFAVNASLGVKSFAELAKLVKSKPGTSTTWRRRYRRSPSWRASTKRTAPTSCACRSRAAAMPSPACSTAQPKSPSSASAI